MKEKEISSDPIKGDEPETPEARLSRREAVIKGAVALGAVAVAMYVPPKLTSVGSPLKARGDDRGVIPSAHAKSAPANKENCEKDPNEDCDKCARDKDPSEKDPKADGSEKDPTKEEYDKCVQEKPCDKDPGEKDPNVDKDPSEKDPASDKGAETSSSQIEPKQFTGPVKDEWG
jgi:hypothetical protein